MKGMPKILKGIPFFLICYFKLPIYVHLNDSISLILQP